MINYTIKAALKKILISSVIASITLSSLQVFGENTSINDLDKSSVYAREAIAELAGKDIITGDSQGNFNPAQNITRGQMITILTRVLDLDITNPPAKATFKDVPTTHWAFPYVEAAYKRGIVTGLSKDIFGIDQLCTREQMAALFVRALGISESAINEAYGTQSTNALSDKSKISAYSKSYVEFSLSTGLMTGTSSKTFGPTEYAKREQAAVVTHRFINNRDSIINLPSKDLELDANEIAVLKKSVVMIKTYDKAGGLMTQGSGFAVAKGLFLTNYHVLDGASKYTITDINGISYAVEGIAKYNADLDLAIIKTKEPINIAPVKLGTKNGMEKADRVITIGYPQGLQNTVSEGIVSGVRKFDYGKSGSIDIIQNTAPIGKGGFGGALFDMNGNVIGVNTSTSEEGNLRFAVAIDHAKGWIQELQAKSFSSITVIDMSKVIAGYLNFSEESIKSAIYKAFRAMEEKDINAYMATVHPLSPGYRATQEEYNKFFLAYNLDFDITDLDVIERSYGEAVVDMVYTIRRVDIQEADTLRVYGRYILEKHNGEWMIYFASELLRDYPKEVRHDTGIGGISKEEALWAYEEEQKNQQNEVKINGKALNFIVADSIIDPIKPIIYASDMYSKKVYAYNYETGLSKEIKFALTPENLAFAGDEIYVSLLKGKHSPYWYSEDQKGAIAIIDRETLQIKEQLDIDIDPFDIVAGRDGHIYVTSGSGQHAQFKSYSRKTLQEVSSSGVDGGSYAELHPNKDVIYTTNTSSPRDIVTYNISQGKFTDPAYPGGRDSYYHGQYEIGKKFIFSPDGTYLINSAGTIFKSSGGSVIYQTSIGREFIEAVFAPDGNSFYTGIKGGLIYEYAYPSFKPTNTYKVQGEIVKMYCRDSKLTVITKANNKNYIETIQLAK